MELNELFNVTLADVFGVTQDQLEQTIFNSKSCLKKTSKCKSYSSPIIVKKRKAKRIIKEEKHE